MKLSAREKARCIAEVECQRRGWPLLEPVRVYWGLFTYTVWGGGRGGGVRIKIRKKDGVVMDAIMTPL